MDYCITRKFMHIQQVIVLKKNYSDIMEKSQRKKSY